MVTELKSGSFSIEPGFCPDCGTILPSQMGTDNIICYSCERKYNAREVLGEMEISFDVKFVKKDLNAIPESVEDKDDEPDGPIVERMCPQCKNNQMSYATLQMRSADEGQTVFYTCTKCKFKETENS